MYFFTVILKNCPLRFSHNNTVFHRSIIHDDKTVISYFMPRHQTLKFSYDFKAKRYNMNLKNKNQSDHKHFGVFICD